MSQHLVNQYLNDLDRYKKMSGSLTEGVISEAFKDLLKAWARPVITRSVANIIRTNYCVEAEVVSIFPMGCHRMKHG